MTCFGRTETANRESGVTLVELLVAITIVALALAVTLPSVRTPSPTLDVRLQAQRIASAMQAARATAVAKSTDVGFVFDAKANTWAIDAGVSGPQALSIGTTLKLETARAAIRADDVGRLIFFSDGSTTGGRVSLIKGGLATTISVEWLTGAVSIEKVGG